MYGLEIDNSNKDTFPTIETSKNKLDINTIKTCQRHAQVEPDDEIKNLKNKVVLTEFQLIDLTNTIDKLSQDINTIKSSTSWRITAPIRMVSTIADKVFKIFRYRRHRMEVAAPVNTQSSGSDILDSIEKEQQLDLLSSRKKLPTGWVIISAEIFTALSLCPELYVADENGFSSDRKEMLMIDNKNKIHQLIRLPSMVQGLRLNFFGSQDQLKITACNITEIGALQVLMIITYKKFLKALFRPGKILDKIRRGIVFFRTNSLSDVFERIMKMGGESDYQKWIQAYSTITDDDRIQILSHIKNMKYKPLISVILPVYNTPEHLLMAAIESVKNQIYDNWELCIADDASTLPHIRTILNVCQKNDKRIKVIFRKKNGHISACSNSALSLATGEFTALLDHDDKLSSHALYMVVQELNRFPDTDILYSDEDKINLYGERHSPHFKPDWNAELFFSINYISHLGVYRTRLIRSIDGFRQGVEGSQDYDLVLRCLQLTDSSKIRHIPHILYHWRATEGSTALSNQEKSYATKAGIHALKDFFAAKKIPAKITGCTYPTTYRVSYPIEKEPRVSIIIPTKNNHKMLKSCIDSITEKTIYQNYEVVIVNNQSDDLDTLSYLYSLREDPICRVISYDYEFNYSAVNNFAVNNTKGELLALVNDDIEVITPEWLNEMVSYAIQPDVGAVGAKLLYPDHRIQHAGVILGLGGVAGHSHKYMDGTGKESGYFHRLLLPQAVSAVTAACLLLKRQVYQQVGGLDPLNLAVAFNDVDLCLRITMAGYRNIWTPYAVLYHHESVSRGYEDTREKQARFAKEIAYMKKTWGVQLKNDPYYNPNLSMMTENFDLAFPSRAPRPWYSYAECKNRNSHRTPTGSED